MELGYKREMDWYVRVNLFIISCFGHLAAAFGEIGVSSHLHSNSKYLYIASKTFCIRMS